jgi:chromosomal replication initiator protein
MLLELPKMQAGDGPSAADADIVTLAKTWSSIRTQLRSEFGASAFEKWLKPLELASVRDRTVSLAASTSFMRDWVSSHYGDRLRALWIQQAPHISQVDLIANGALVRSSAATPAEPIMAPAPAAQDSDVGMPLDERYTFERFVVGRSNEFAYTAAQRVAEGGPVSFNPLFLHGGVGLGKTHLMHAIGWEIKKRARNRRIAYLSTEQFMLQFMAALRHKDTIMFKQRFRSVDVLMIDDIQFLADKNVTQDEFFHTFNALIDTGKQLVISADRSPSDLQGIEDRIRSRLGWGLVADIHATDFELRLGILHTKLETLEGTRPPTEILEFLARRITSNVRELEGALRRLVAHATLIGRPITMDMVKDVLQDLLRANDRRVTVEDIQRRVADYYKLRLHDLLSARRSREVARPRQVAMYLSKKLTPRSLPEIGRRFGGRDHTTVMHAIKRIEELRNVDSELETDIGNLSRLLDG